MGWLERLLLKTVAAMIGFNTLFAVMTVLVKKAIDGSLNPIVLIALRQLVGAAFLAQITYFIEKECKTKIHNGDLCLLVHEGATWVMSLCSFGNPDWGTIRSVSVLLGLELHHCNSGCNRLQYNLSLCLPACPPSPSKTGLAKIAETMASVGGVVLLSLYKGSDMTHATSSVEEHNGNGTMGSSVTHGVARDELIATPGRLTLSPTL